MGELSPTQVGERILSLRKARGWNQRRLAQEAGVSHPFVSQVERGQSGISEPVLKQFAAALGVPLEELTGEPMRPAPELLERELSSDESRIIRALRKVAPLSERRVL